MAKTIFCIWNFQLAENYGCFCFVIIKIYVHKLFCLLLILNLDWYAASLNSVEIMKKVWKSICMAPNQKNEMENRFWLTDLVNLKFAPIFI